MSVNKVILVGRLGQNPEVRYTPGGAGVANFSVATNETWNDKQGQKQERTEWHRIVVWGKLAELCGQYLTKGRQVYLEGRMQTRQWQDKDGQTKYTTEVHAQTVQFLGAGAGAGAESGGASAGGGYEQRGGGAQMGGGASFGMSGGAGGNMNMGGGGPGAMGGGMPSGPMGGGAPGLNDATSFTEDDIPF